MHMICFVMFVDFLPVFHRLCLSKLTLHNNPNMTSKVTLCSRNYIPSVVPRRMPFCGFFELQTKCFGRGCKLSSGLLIGAQDSLLEIYIVVGFIAIFVFKIQNKITNDIYP